MDFKWHKLSFWLMLTGIGSSEASCYQDCLDSCGTSYDVCGSSSIIGPGVCGDIYLRCKQNCGETGGNCPSPPTTPPPTNPPEPTTSPTTSAPTVNPFLPSACRKGFVIEGACTGLPSELINDKLFLPIDESSHCSSFTSRPNQCINHPDPEVSYPPEIQSTCDFRNNRQPNTTVYRSERIYLQQGYTYRWLFQVNNSCNELGVDCVWQIVRGSHNFCTGGSRGGIRATFLAGREPHFNTSGTIQCLTDPDLPLPTGAGNMTSHCRYTTEEEEDNNSDNYSDLENSSSSSFVAMAALFSIFLSSLWLLLA